jgi:hypothetical protein
MNVAVNIAKTGRGFIFNRDGSVAMFSCLLSVYVLMNFDTNIFGDSHVLVGQKAMIKLHKSNI